MNKSNLYRARMRSLVLAVGTLGLGVTGTSWAGPGGPGGPEVSKECRRLHFERHAKPFDTNQDGRLDRDERKAMHEAKRAANLAKYDADGDGKLSDTERHKLHYDRVLGHFDELDKDRSGEISTDEAVGSCTPLARYFQRVDADANGVVTWAEFEAGVRKHAGSGRGQRHRHKSDTR